MARKYKFIANTVWPSTKTVCNFFSFGPPTTKGWRPLEWKINIRPNVFISYDQYIVEKNKFDLFCSLSKKACYAVLESILNSWEITLKSQLQLDGQIRIPKLSCNPREIPIEI